MTATETFAARVIAWQREHGRHDLPWQQDRTAYRVWLSEIMLQQTQVATVIPYFERFTDAFPTVAALAAAPLDAVLHLWSGLGYYSRARNLHRAAVKVMTEHAGEFPRTVTALSELPGVGRSTAGAIVTLAFDERAPILDGNVKRVLARYHEVVGWPGESRVLKRLWQLAESHLPDHDHRVYTQALMDLGATLCTRTRPDCERCPLGADCGARASSRTSDYPGRKPRKVVPLRDTTFLLIENSAGELLLERRPERGVWGGLWCFPEHDGDALPDARLEHRLAELGVRLERELETLDAFTHTFTHFRLRITPRRLRAAAGAVRDCPDQRWARPDDLPALGLPRAVTKLAGRLA